MRIRIFWLAGCGCALAGAIASCSTGVPSYCAPGTRECTPVDGGNDSTLADSADVTPEANGASDAGDGGAAESAPALDANPDSADAWDGFDGFVCDRTKTPRQDTCVIDDTLGVFVSPTGSDTGDAGTKERPFATLAYALAHLGPSQRVYACAATFNESNTVAITSAVSVFGGLQCPSGASSDWSYLDGGVATLSGPQNQTALVIQTASGAVDVEDLAVSAPSATGRDPAGNGLSSVAIVVNASTVTFRRCSFSAGNGADGANGTPRSNYDGGTNAPNGQAGDDAGNGGQGGAVQCGDGTSSLGGNGGSGTLTPTGGGDGGAVPMPNTMGGGGAGGASGIGLAACGGGNSGANGSPPVMPNAPDAGGGTWADGGWVPGGGLAGSNGNPGQGGGGGGGKHILPGTGGGAGGCGGAGGTGGAGGGASLALVCLASSVTLDSCTLSTGQGGAGGKGADGQSGQGGGSSTTPPLGCSGGFGGNGAGGAGGAGGPGGSCACVAYRGPPPSGLPTCNLGAPGKPGPSGKGAAGGNTMPDMGNPGAAGPDGIDGGAGASQATLPL